MSDVLVKLLGIDVEFQKGIGRFSMQYAVAKKIVILNLKGATLRMRSEKVVAHQFELVQIRHNQHI
jgi:hypothetical protein